MKLWGKKITLSEGSLAFFRNSRGSIAMATGLFSPILIMAVGVGIDTAIFNFKRTELQNAADQSAIAATKELALADATVAQIKAAAIAFATKTTEGSIENLVATPEVFQEEGAVKLQLSHDWAPFLGHYLGLAKTPIVVQAKAKLVGSTKVCVLTLSKDDQKSLELTKTAQIIAKECGVFANSTRSQAISLDSMARIEAEATCSAGGIDYTPGRIEAEPMMDCVTITDPLADRPEPSVGACTSQANIFSSGAHTLDDGNFCGGLKISGTAKVKLNAGTYIMSQGDFEVTGDASIEGDDVTIYFADSDSKLSLKGKATVNLAGAKSGDLAGLLFFGSRSQTVGTNHNIKADNANRLTGTIYLPTGDLLVDPNSKVADQSEYTSIIVHTLRVKEGPELIMNSRYGDSDVPVPLGIRANAQVVIDE